MPPLSQTHQINLSVSTFTHLSPLHKKKRSHGFTRLSLVRNSRIPQHTALGAQTLFEFQTRQSKTQAATARDT